MLSVEVGQAESKLVVSSWELEVRKFAYQTYVICFKVQMYIFMTDSQHS